MNEAAEEREEEEAVKGKKKRGAAARAESKPKRKRIQVRYDMPGMYRVTQKKLENLPLT